MSQPSMGSSSGGRSPGRPASGVSPTLVGTAALLFFALLAVVSWWLMKAPVEGDLVDLAARTGPDSQESAPPGGVSGGGTLPALARRVPDLAPPLPYEGDFRSRYEAVWTVDSNEVMQRSLRRQRLRFVEGDSNLWMSTAPPMPEPLESCDPRLVGVWFRAAEDGTAQRPALYDWFKVLRADGDMAEGIGDPGRIGADAEGPDHDRHRWRASGGLLQYRPLTGADERCLQYSYRLQGEDHLMLFDRSGRAESWWRTTVR